MGILSGNIKSGLVQFLVNDPTGENTVIQLDASIRETHGRRSPATKFPIENGVSISDHIILEPFELEITGIITDSPIGTTSQLIREGAGTLTSSLLPPITPVVAGGAYALYNALSGTKSPSAVAYQKLLNLQSNAIPFDVLTSLYRYPSMWITDLSVPRSLETGQALEFTVKLAQLILVSPQSVNVAIFANPSLAANQGNLGEQGLQLSQKYQQGFSEGTTLSGATTTVNGGVPPAR